MTTRAAAKSKSKKPLETTLGKAPSYTSEDPIDLSHVRKPIDTSIFGLSQVLRLFETSTDEVRRYVAYECDIMYECRMCRTIYRSLANFILHKRNFCRDSYNANDHTNCRNSCLENEFNILQEDADTYIKNFKKQSSRDVSPEPPKCESKSKHAPEVVQMLETDSDQSEPKDKKNLNSVLTRLRSKQQNILITEQCLSEDISDESRCSENEKVKNNVSLEKIPDTDSGVFQTMFQNMVQEYATSKMDFMKTQVLEIHDILENNEAILGPDGKIITPTIEEGTQLKNNFMCTVCNQKFSTQKTLTYHINYKHNPSRPIYRCTECEDTFASAWGVFRHLFKIHRKTQAQAKRLRNQIHANKIRKDEYVQNNVQKRVNNLKINSIRPLDLQGRVDLENQQWMDDLEGDNDLQRCGGCGRKFERKAALHSHSQFCTKRIAVCNTIKENSAKRTQNEDKQEKITKSAKAVTNSESERNSVRRRKPLVAQRYYKTDYVKENQNTKQECQSDRSNLPVNHDSDDENEKIKMGKLVHEIQINDKVEAVECDKLANEEENDTIKNVIIGNNNINVVTDTETVNVLTSNTNQNNNDYSNTLSISSDSGITEDNTLVNNRTTFTRDSIITRSKSSAISDLVENNLVQLHNTASIDGSTEVNRIIVNSEIPTSNPPDNSELSEITAKDIQSEPIEPVNETHEIFVEDIEILNAAADENTSDIKNNSDSENAPQRNAIQVSTIHQQKSYVEDSKHKKNMFIDNSEPQNSQHQKNEESIEIANGETKKIAAVKDSNVKTKITLEMRSTTYIDKVKHSCLPCKKIFKSHKSLIKHMALHFSWYRYQCRSCDFMTYSRSKCDRHVEKSHAVHDEATLKNYVLHIPQWKTIQLSSDFKKYCRKHKIECDKTKKVQDVPSVCPKTKVEETTTDKDVNCHGRKQLLQNVKCSNSDKGSPPNEKDPQFRMIMEVIFGSEVGSLNQCKVEESQGTSSLKTVVESDSSTVKNGKQESSHNRHPNEDQAVALKDNSRPVRNRTVPVQKDFLYDMKQILKSSKREKDIPSPESLKEASPVKKPKTLKIYVKKTKPKLKKSDISTDKPDVNRSISSVQSSCSALDITEDININSKNVTQKHVTGDCI